MSAAVAVMILVTWPLTVWWLRQHRSGRESPSSRWPRGRRVALLVAIVALVPQSVALATYSYDERARLAGAAQGLTGAATTSAFETHTDSQRGEQRAADPSRSLTSRIGLGRAAKAATTVLGHYPEYVQLAEQIDARTFSVPGHAWDAMSPAEQWAANQKFP
ncbi:MAG TPA: hypothetical protein VNT03_22315 [Baekduia sp.]|nr:hypothetical protein [Baekduia sp.]